MDDGFYLGEVVRDEHGKPVDIFYFDENAAAIRLMSSPPTVVLSTGGGSNITMNFIFYPQQIA
jgi:hypothetical protein